MNELIERLQKLKDDRGAMAALRQGLNKRTCWRTWPYIPEYLSNDRMREIAQTVAAAFAYHPEARQTGNIGTTCRELVAGGERSTFDARFQRLLMAQSVPEVCRHLRHIILAAARSNASLEFNQLFEDLKYWPGQRVRIRWASEYYKKGGEDVSDESSG